MLLGASFGEPFFDSGIVPYGAQSMETFAMRGYFFTVFGIMAFIVPSITISTFIMACGACSFTNSIFRLL
jgi:hypothetical protein